MRAPVGYGKGRRATKLGSSTADCAQARRQVVDAGVEPQVVS
ncbi:hypothetical protein I552_6440 [Mycobacterium xenopi 3993]|nr:hypothetical protein I552_6440 [Mycobacterium xenopi 3993]